MNGAAPAQDTLAQLRDIHLPPPVGWWPPAPGWWLLAALALALLTFALVYWLRRRRAQRYRRIALAQLRALYRQWQRCGDAQAYLLGLNQLLKQTALAAYPRRDIAALNGDAWLSFLDSSLQRAQFAEPPARALATVYAAHADAIEPGALQRAAEYWIRRHRC